jgi:hypothetical protein
LLLNVSGPVLAEIAFAENPVSMNEGADTDIGENRLLPAGCMMPVPGELSGVAWIPGSTKEDVAMTPDVARGCIRPDAAERDPPAVFMIPVLTTGCIKPVESEPPYDGKGLIARSKPGP